MRRRPRAPPAPGSGRTVQSSPSPCGTCKETRTAVFRKSANRIRDGSAIPMSARVAASSRRRSTRDQQASATRLRRSQDHTTSRAPRTAQSVDVGMRRRSEGGGGHRCRYTTVPTRNTGPTGTADEVSWTGPPHAAFTDVAIRATPPRSAAIWLSKSCDPDDLRTRRRTKAQPCGTDEEQQSGGDPSGCFSVDCRHAAPPEPGLVDSAMRARVDTRDRCYRFMHRSLRARIVLLHAHRFWDVIGDG